MSSGDTFYALYKAFTDFLNASPIAESLTGIYAEMGPINVGDSPYLVINVLGGKPTYDRTFGEEISAIETLRVQLAIWVTGDEVLKAGFLLRGELWEYCNVFDLPISVDTWQGKATVQRVEYSNIPVEKWWNFVTDYDVTFNEA